MPNDAETKRDSTRHQDENRSDEDAGKNRPRRVIAQATAILQPDPNTLKAR